MTPPLEEPVGVNLRHCLPVASERQSDRGWRDEEPEYVGRCNDKRNKANGAVRKLKNRKVRTLPPIGSPLAMVLVTCLAVIMVTLAFTDTVAALLAVVSVLVTGIVGLSLTWSGQHSWTGKNLSLLETPFFLSHDVDVFAHYRRIAGSLLRMSQLRDPVFRETAAGKLTELADQIDELASGTIVFSETETWRMTYETLLRTRGLYRYRSVAWARSPSYWQDQPGRQSTRLNFEIQQQDSIIVERIVILADELWSGPDKLPVEQIRQWIHEQSSRGVDVRLVRESSLRSEPDLIADIGIYGNRAVGIQEMDEKCQTVRFTLHFDMQQLAAAEDRWDRLRIYATKYEEFLDQFTLYE